MTIRVMLVDDSAIIRGLIAKAITKDPNIEVIATAVNGAAALVMARQHQPDVIILDIEMPEMDGIAALPKLLEIVPNVHVIMASTLTERNASISLRALELGASDYVPKPAAKDPQALEAFYSELRSKIAALGAARKMRAGGMPSPSLPPSISKPFTSAVSPAAPTLSAQKIASALSAATPSTSPFLPVKALAIASSTGGPQALLHVFTGLRGKLPHIPIFITQHMPATFTTLLAEHIAKAGERPCKEGLNGDVVKPGEAYVAPGDYHMVVEKSGTQVIIRNNQNPPENFCRPAADPMLRALSQVYGPGLLTLVLTGMGQDGLEGAKVVIKNGGNIISQDEATSVVWGMPKAVSDAGISRAILPLADIAPYLIKVC